MIMIAVAAFLVADVEYVDVSVERIEKEAPAQTDARLKRVLLRELGGVDVDGHRCRARGVMFDASVFPMVERKMTFEPQVIPPLAELAIDDELRRAMRAVCDASEPSDVRRFVIVDEKELAPDVVGCDVEHAEVTSIELRRFGCLGVCPIDDVVLFADGRVAYEGIASVKLVGKRNGRVNVTKFHEIARALDAAGFFCMADGYRKLATDQPGYDVTATTTRDRKKVSDYGFAAPRGLFDAREAALKLLDDVTWDP